MSQREIKKKVHELNGNENTTYQELIHSAVLRGKFITINAYMGKEKRFSINHYNLHFNTSEKK